ncbi:MAG: cob(I)yrinic acid a,c-diamide adenosyltransferase [Alcaligenaceae bacterium]|jgi:cob(I)alamin adenosyltransferase|nr:cob(I)yrinic acid a,c-diamide adenosyltransferase [Alcaligenaceae bacterium]HZJ96876.1 cob(I)yrinic acid a,c-diamide adenosyltransferase [Oligella sp.]
MTNRLSSIVTKTGDAGTTGLADGQRLLKSHPRICAIGEIDELNSHIGLLISQLQHISDLEVEAHLALLSKIQHSLFDLGSELAIPGYNALSESIVAKIEQSIESMLEQLPPLREFILPGGTQEASQAHICRSVSRRSERALVTLNTEEPISDLSIQLVNRLSDYFFVLARELNRLAKRTDIFWQKSAQ